MKKIESYEQCSLLIKDFKKGSNKSTTNFFFMPEELKNIIANKVVKYQVNKELLIFFIEEADFIHIFYFAKGESASALKSTGKVMIIDLVERNIGDSKTTKSEVDRWLLVGFKEYKQYIRLKYSIKKPTGIKKTVQYKNYNLSCAEPVDMNTISNLWGTNLDRYSTPLPSNADMRKLIQSGHVYVAKQNDTVSGAVYMDTGSKSCILRHLVVNPLCRRQGIGTALMGYALKRVALEGIEKCYLWVDMNNMPAYESYKKYGFEEDGLCTKQLICSGQDVMY